MNDDDWHAEEVPLTPKGVPGARSCLGVRVTRAFGAAVAFLLLLYPWGGNRFFFGGNFFRGPLLLFCVGDPWAGLEGGLVAIALTPAIFAYLLKPGRLTAAISIAGIVAWHVYGMRILANAV
jgi:hypothetical protein